CFTTKPDAPARSASAASWASACMVRKITLLALASALSRCRASSPLTPGIATSVTMTSGRSWRAASINRAPSATVPTSENSLRSRLASPSMTIAWSSARSTVARRIPDLGQRHHDLDLRASLRLGVDREAASREADPFVEADQAQAAAPLPLREVKPAPVVTDREHEVGPVARRDHSHPAGFRMPGNILERLLRDAIEAEREVGRHGAEVVV